MSVNYWSVTGYGVNLEGNIFDLKKVSSILDLEDDFEDLEGLESPFSGYIGDIVLQDVIEEALSQKGFEMHSKYLNYQDTGNNQMGSFLLYNPSYPWRMSDEEKMLKEGDIQNMILEVLETITILSRDEIIERFEEVYLGGEG